MSLVEIDIEDLSQALDLLSNNPYTIISSEPEGSNIRKAVKLVVLAFTILRETEYDLMHNMISKLPRPTYLKPDSVGAFLFGDYLMCYGDVPKRCSVLSLHSIPKSNTQTYSIKSESCPHQVWLLKKGRNNENYYAAIVSSGSKDAMIFIDTNDNNSFEGFKRHEVELFTNRGIEYVTVLSVGNPTHSTIVKKTKLSEINVIDDDYICEPDEISNNSSIYFFYLLALIILIILIIIIAINC